MDKSKTLLSNSSTYSLNTGKVEYLLKSVLGGGGFGITYLAERTVYEGDIPQIHRYTIKEFSWQTSVSVIRTDMCWWMMPTWRITKKAVLTSSPRRIACITSIMRVSCLSTRCLKPTILSIM